MSPQSLNGFCYDLSSANLFLKAKLRQKKIHKSAYLSKQRTFFQSNHYEKMLR